MGTIAKQGGVDTLSMVITSYGSLDGLSKFLIDNNTSIPEIEAAPIGNVFKVAEGVFYDNEFAFNRPTFKTTTIKGLKSINQNWFDYLITTYGTLEGLSECVSLNNFTRTIDFDFVSSGSYLKVNNTTQSLIYNGKVAATAYSPISDSDYSLDFNLDFKS